jgi:DNA-binding transcriptional ArsR family regulator
MDTNKAAEVFGSLSQETRLKTLGLLVESGPGGMAAGTISRALNVPQNTLSFHLGHLERANLIISRRAGRSIIYRASNDGMKSLLSYMLENCCPKR